MLFLKNCLEEQVICKSLLPKKLRNYNSKPFGPFEKIILEEHLKNTKLDRTSQAKHVEQIKYKLRKTLSKNDFHNAMDFCYNNMKRINNKLKKKLDKKLKYLIKNSLWEENATQNSVINLSSKNLDNIAALRYGISFSANWKKPNASEVLESVQKLKIKEDHRNILKGMLYHSMSKPCDSKIPKRFVKVINNLRKDNEIHITRADKSKTLVIMNKQEYNNKMHNLLSDINVYREVQLNDINKINKNFNDSFNKIFKEYKELKQQLRVFTPSPAYLYGLVKTHKENYPMRPVISSVTTAQYKLSKWLVKILSPLLGNISQSHIKNNIDLLDKLNNLKLNYDFKMYSFDVKSLYTNIPVDDLLLFLEKELENYNMPFSIPIIITLIKLCVKDYAFVFDEKYYIQISGLGMGNPLSALLANLYMEFFERDILSKLNLTKKITWLRYVDDVYATVEEGCDIEDILHKINQCVPSIKFTIEHEKDCTLPFLDVLIHRIDRTFQYEIYRKPTNINSFIHNYSNHEINIKQSTFRFMFLRALRIVSPQYLDREISFIYQIGYNHKYSKTFIDKCFQLAKRTFYGEKININTPLHNILVLPYHDNFRTLPKLCKLLNITVIFKYNNKINNLLINNTPSIKQGTVYKINCKNCDKFYIGETGRNLSTRLSEHNYAIKSKNQYNALFIHYLTTGHHMDINNALTLFNCNSYHKRLLIESLIIKNTYDDNINLIKDSDNIDKIGQTFLNNQLNLKI